MKKIILALPFLMFASGALAQATGTLQVNGEPSKVQLFQKVKVVRCAAPGQCDAPVLFSLNKAQSLAAGNYIVGFENTINPEMVRIDAGSNTVLNLKTISVPGSVTGQKIKAFRDLSDAVEKRKILMTFFQLKQHFFRLESETFGDLYLTGSWDRDTVRRFDYSICPKVPDIRKGNRHVPDQALLICSLWTGATSAPNLAGLFEFAADGTLEQSWVSYPGDLFKTKLSRHLVAVPMTGADTIAVFPGVYKFQSEDPAIPAVTVRVDN